MEHLFKSILDNDLNRVKEVLKKNPNLLNMSDASGHSPLTLAVARNYEDIVKFLLTQNRIDVNYIFRPFKWTPLTLAIVRKRNIKIIKMLLKHPRIDINLNTVKTPLEQAMDRKEYNIVELLLKRNDIDVSVHSRDNWTPLSEAIYSKDEKLVKMILDSGKVNINRSYDNRMTYLMIAMNTKNINMVKMLIDHGADPNKIDDRGFYPLLYAVFLKNKDLISLLLKAGADRDYGKLHRVDKEYLDLIFPEAEKIRNFILKSKTGKDVRKKTGKILSRISMLPKGTRASFIYQDENGKANMLSIKMMESGSTIKKLGKHFSDLSPGRYTKKRIVRSLSNDKNPLAFIRKRYSDSDVFYVL